MSEGGTRADTSAERSCGSGARTGNLSRPITRWNPSSPSPPRSSRRAATPTRRRKGSPRNGNDAGRGRPAGERRAFDQHTERFAKATIPVCGFGVSRRRRATPATETRADHRMKTSRSRSRRRRKRRKYRPTWSSRGSEASFAPKLCNEKTLIFQWPIFVAKILNCGERDPSERQLFGLPVTALSATGEHCAQTSRGRMWCSPHIEGLKRSDPDTTGRSRRPRCFGWETA
jgi:hypothetical protein